ncbi:isochorismate synthase [Nocardioides zeae]|uniref:isochorismate synthase n=1 Tax=Nocardioides zeae TaxID=1457234 RepID=A0A6P0HGC7_9ACTN|nr:isochorismate synthase [Nocardioides zeae]NEN77693.1 isochorismate synthase [Nocardioides zeae]
MTSSASEPGTTTAGTVSLVARTVPLDGTPGDLVDLLPADAPLAWVRAGDGIVGWGVAAEVTTSGADRFADAEAWWASLTSRAVVRDDVGLPGTGLVAFGSFAFADAPGTSTLVVPRVVVGQRGGRRWLTTIGHDTIGSPALRLAEPPAAPTGLRFTGGGLADDAWQAAVADAVARIDAGELEKVVLARDVVAETDEPVDVRWPLRRLAAAYSSCWTFHVDGLFGATPEMLVRRERGLVTSRVLAGTIRRTGDDVRDAGLAGELARSSKDLEEHEYAVRSVADALEPHCSSMNVPESPFVLHLPNVMHLATDVNGVVPDEATTTSLGLAASLHPSAAVGGTPTPAATALIAELEGMTRGRYAGPVGWMDASGDGEWGIALRSAQVVAPDPATGRGRVRLFAGCGIVAGSDPADELAESQAKLEPVRHALDA